MPSLNHVTLVGHLGRDAEPRFTPQGKAVTEFTLAVTTRFGQGAEETAWVRVTCWGGWAESAGRLKKGEAVMVDGRLRTESWESKTTPGKQESRTTVTASCVLKIQRDDIKASEQQELPATKPAGKAAPAVDDSDNMPF